MEETVKLLTIEHRDTREKFESRCKSRYVVVRVDPDEGAADYMGMVVGFHPGEKVSVMDVAGYTHEVPLRRVEEDVGQLFSLPRAAG